MTAPGRDHERGHRARESCQAESGRSERGRSGDGPTSGLVQAACRRGCGAAHVRSLPGDAAVCIGWRQLATPVDGRGHGRASDPCRRRRVGFGGSGLDGDRHGRAPALRPGRAHELPQCSDRQELAPFPPLPRAWGVCQSVRPDASDDYRSQSPADSRGPPRNQRVERRPSRELLGLCRHGRERLSDRDRALPAPGRHDRPGDNLGRARALDYRRLSDRSRRARRFGPCPAR